MRLLTCPRPVVMACTRHALAAGVVLLCTADWRIAATGEFKIGLPVLAAFLTIIGYSLNDTIVVFDRIRENRGRLTAIS